MSARKKCKLVHGEIMGSPPTTPGPIDWSLCALCQEHLDKPLVCPANSKRTDIGAGYDSLGDHLTSFRCAGKEPLPIEINRLDEGDGISSTMTRNHAKWHTSYRLKCCASRVARIVQPSPGTSETPGGHPYMRRQATRREILIEDRKCFFCDEVGTEAAPLHAAMTPKITQRVRICAMKLQDKKLIAKLCPGDLVAQEAKYHSQCLVKLYNASSRKVEEGKHENTDRVSHGIALVELIGYIQEAKISAKDVVPIFKMADLLQLYTDRLIELGVDITGRIHSTYLKIEYSQMCQVSILTKKVEMSC